MAGTHSRVGRPRVAARLTLGHCPTPARTCLDTVTPDQTAAVSCRGFCEEKRSCPSPKLRKQCSPKPLKQARRNRPTDTTDPRGSSPARRSFGHEAITAGAICVERSKQSPSRARRSAGQLGCTAGPQAWNLAARSRSAIPDNERTDRTNSPRVLRPRPVPPFRAVATFPVDADPRRAPASGAPQPAPRQRVHSRAADADGADLRAATNRLLLPADAHSRRAAMPWTDLRAFVVAPQEPIARRRNTNTQGAGFPRVRRRSSGAADRAAEQEGQGAEHQEEGYQGEGAFAIGADERFSPPRSGGRNPPASASFSHDEIEHDDSDWKIVA